MYLDIIIFYMNKWHVMSLQCLFIYFHLTLLKYFKECLAEWLVLKHFHLTTAGPLCKKSRHPWTRKNIAWDVDEVLWSNPETRG